MQRSESLELGKAGEHLVCADLIMSGHHAFLADQGLPYDVIAEAGNRLLRVQVKSLSGPIGKRFDVYTFQLIHNLRKGRKSYPAGTVDLFALVALDLKQVAYVLPSERTYLSLRAPGSNRGNQSSGNLDDFTFARAIRDSVRKESEEATQIQASSM